MGPPRPPGTKVNSEMLKKLHVGRAAIVALALFAAAVLASPLTVLAQAAPDKKKPEGPMSYEAGKNAVQIFQTDCAICHKSPQGLAKQHGFGLQGFLREHYTASREAAAALAQYLEAVGEGRPAPTRANTRRAPKEEVKPKDEAPPAGDASGEPKPKPAAKKQAKPADMPQELGIAASQKPAADKKPAAKKPKAGSKKPPADGESDNN